MNRRDFVKSSIAAGIAVALPFSRVRGANDRILVGVVGLGGRGTGAHVPSFENQKGVTVVALSDPDRERMGGAAKTIESKYNHKVEQYVDMRKMFDRKDIDVIGNATQNYWHGLSTIWACQAGKDVYVEKPLSHYIWEGRQMVNAARKYDRSGLGQPWRRTTGLRVWRRDGFTSLVVPTGGKSGTLLTRPIDVKDPDKNSLVLNLHVPDLGTASISILDAATGKPIVGYEKSDPISGIDRINHVVTFSGRSYLTGLNKIKKVRLRITLTGPESQIYSIRFQKK